MFSSFLFLYVFLFKLVLGLSFFDQSKSFLYSSFKLQEAVLFLGHASASFLGLIFFNRATDCAEKEGLPAV